jgi:exopolysaccharide production protein ExoZ
MVIALLYRAGIRLSLFATVVAVVAGILWYAATVPTIPRQYSCGIAAALIVGGMSLSSVPKPKHALILTPILFLGDASYALYLTHTLAFALLGRLAATLSMNPLDYIWPYAGAMLVMSLLIAAATHLMFERPITLVLQRRIKDWRTAQIGARSAAYQTALPHRR